MRQLKIIRQVTNRSDTSLDKYLHEIGKITLLSADTEVELARRIHKGDKAAFELLVASNLRFVISVSKQYQNQGLSLSDIINEGNLGLIKAAQRFDETRGFKFISYAVWWIRQAIMQAIAEQARIVRLPLNKIGSINKINRIYSELEQRHEREPTIAELAQEMEQAPEDIKTLMMSAGRQLSLDAPLTPDDGVTMYDLLPGGDGGFPDNELDSESLKVEIERSLTTLTQREADILRMYFGLGGTTALSLEEIGEQMSLTRERVRQIKERAIKRMKNIGRSKNLKSYLG